MSAGVAARSEEIFLFYRARVRDALMKVEIDSLMQRIGKKKYISIRFIIRFRSITPGHNY